MTYSRLPAVAAMALAFSLTACAKPEPAKPAVDTAKAAEAVKADFADLVAAFNAKDAEKGVSHDLPNYVGMFHGAPNVNGPAEDLALTKQQLADPAANVKVTDSVVDVAAAGDMAVVRATYEYTLTDPKTKKPTVEHGNWVLGYKAQTDGGWKLAWTVVSDTPAPAAAAAPAAEPAK